MNQPQNPQYPQYPQIYPLPSPPPYPVPSHGTPSLPHLPTPVPLPQPPPPQYQPPTPVFPVDPTQTQLPQQPTSPPPLPGSLSPQQPSISVQTLGDAQDRSKKLREEEIKQKIENLGAAIFIEVCGRLIPDTNIGPSLTQDNLKSVAEKSIDATCAFAKVMWGIEAIREKTVPPTPVDSPEPF